MSEKSTIELLSDLKFCVFDLETTGGNQKNDKIIEIGLVKIDNLEIVERKNYLIDPERKIPEFIQKLTSITQKDVEGCQKIEEVIEEILEIIGDRILVAHNASFDVPFFNSVLKRLNRDKLENKSICTNLMTKYLIPTLMNSNLNYMSKIFNITHKKAHRALDDADATAKLFLKYLDIFKSKGIKKLNHLYYPKNRYELDLANFKEGSSSKEIEEKLNSVKVPFIFTIKGENGVILFSIPCSGTGKETEYLMEKVQDNSWHTISIKLIGPFFEALVKYNHLYSKLDNSTKEEVIEKLWSYHLADVDKKDLLKSYDKIKNKDFIIFNNLVPEQFCVYPLVALGHKNELIFRYPGHKKKLVQYINSKVNKIEAKKLRKVFYPPKLKDFIDCYMSYCFLNNKEVSFIDKSIAQKKHEQFFEQIEKFLTENPNPYNYPEYYI